MGCSLRYSGFAFLMIFEFGPYSKHLLGNIVFWGRCCLLILVLLFLCFFVLGLTKVPFGDLFLFFSRVLKQIQVWLWVKKKSPSLVLRCCC